LVDTFNDICGEVQGEPDSPKLNLGQSSTIVGTVSLIAIVAPVVASNESYTVQTPDVLKEAG
jgi:hypothetical protein